MGHLGGGLLLLEKDHHLASWRFDLETVELIGPTCSLTQKE